MKLKYNHGGETQSITLSKKKYPGKRLAIHHNGENFYAPLVDTDDATASNMQTKFNGQLLAVRALPPPEIENISITPPTVSVMQGQSATAIVSASGNEAVTGLSYSLTNPPTWITISDECILIQPSDNDLGEAIVEVVAKDTGSNASMSAAFVAEARLRPIIESLSVIPPAVTVKQGSTSTAVIQAVTNSAVTGLSYSLQGAPSWVSLDQDTIRVAPTSNDTGTSTVNVVAYDTNSSASAAAQIVVSVEEDPKISGVNVPSNGVTVQQGQTTVVTLSSNCNTAVTGIEYSLKSRPHGVPSWVTLNGNLITLAPTTSDGGTYVITVTARDTGSEAKASGSFTVTTSTENRIANIVASDQPGWFVNFGQLWLNYPQQWTLTAACYGNVSSDQIQWIAECNDLTSDLVQFESNITVNEDKSTAVLNFNFHHIKGDDYYVSDVAGYMDLTAYIAGSNPTITYTRRISISC